MDRIDSESGSDSDADVPELGFVVDTYQTRLLDLFRVMLRYRLTPNVGAVIHSFLNSGSQSLRKYL